MLNAESISWQVRRVKFPKYKNETFKKMSKLKREIGVLTCITRIFMMTVDLKPVRLTLGLLACIWN